jgi:hypothetical protein
MRLLDPRFKYIPAARTDVTATWRRFGFRPTTEADRRSRKAQADDAAADDTRSVSVVPRRRPRADLAVSR